MQGITVDKLDRESGPRLRRYYHSIAAAIANAAVAPFNGGNVVLPVRLDGRKALGRIVRAGHIGGTAMDGTGNFDLGIGKKIAAGGGNIDAATIQGVEISILEAGVAQTVGPTIGAGVITYLTLAPDELPANARRAAAQAGAAGSITLDAAAVAVNDFYNDAIVENLTTGERRVITDYNGGTLVASVSPNWALGNPAAGTPFALYHDNLVVRNGDILLATITNTGGGAKPTQNYIFVDVVELNVFEANLV